MLSVGKLIVYNRFLEIFTSEPGVTDNVREFCITMAIVAELLTE